MHFRLIRLAVVRLEATLTEWHECTHTESDITLSPFGVPQLLSVSSQGTGFILEASRNLESVLPCSGNVISIPDAVRLEMESLLETHVDLLSIVYRCRGSIFSPHPYIAIEPLDEDAVSWLEGKRIHVSTTGIPMRMWHNRSFADVLPHLKDRLDGVALLAESLEHSHPTGKLHEFMRLFERAFAASAGSICSGPLATFLRQADQGFTQAEVDRWLALRDSTAHADRRSVFALRADTCPVVNRMEQAAYDVLFNKTKWRDRSLQRRNVFRPCCGSSAPSDGSIFITAGQPARLDMPVLDGFHAFPYDVNTQITSLPPGWVTTTTAEQMKSGSGTGP